MPSKLLRTILSRIHGTLNNVVLGITLMALIALYIAIGSGFPRLREMFEMNEMQFFNAWPLKSLMALLIASLCVVTWTRIPLTPPRYGVWCIHAGIITLILGTGFYYHNKIEGLTRIPTGQSIDYFYDGGMRALYARTDFMTSQPWQLPTLPRFKSYTNPDSLRGRDLRDFTPDFMTADSTSTEPKVDSLAAELGVPDVHLDVTGYWPYAEVKTNFVESPESNDTGISVQLSDSQNGSSGKSAWLVASDPAARELDLGGVELEHRVADDPAQLAALRQAATQFHRIDAKIGDFSQTMFVEIGKTYTLGDTGYSFTVETFNPAFPMSGTGEIVQALTLHVVSKAPATAREFRRMVLGGKPLQTDFALNVASAGPMGKRQKEPIDASLTLLYTLSDPFQLLPGQGREKHVLITASTPGILDIDTSLGRASSVNDLPTGSGQITVSPGDDEVPPFAGASADTQNPHAHTSVALHVERKDHIRRDEHVIEVPSAQRDRDTGQAGLFQVLRVKVSSGKWWQEVMVPYSQYAAEEDWNEMVTQDGRTVSRSVPILIPGARVPLTLRLGQQYRPLPARLTLERFDAVPYEGLGASGSSLMRDFCSTLTVEDRETNEKTTDVAHMNHPVYFNNGSWLFFQAQWDPQGQKWTVLGVGNRPGVGIMVLGCVMIVTGLLYAFYAKPIIIRRMKQRALREAAARNARREPVAANV